MPCWWSWSFPSIFVRASSPFECLLRLRNDLRNVREMQNEVAQFRHERQPRVSDPHVVCHHEHLGEESIDGGAKAGDFDKCGAIVAAGSGRLDARTPAIEL